MSYLLDTVALIFWFGDAPQLRRSAKKVLTDADSVVCVSVISVLEIANKNRIGKLPELDGFSSRFEPMVRTNGMTILSLTADHAMRAGYLPGTHRDPFDRLLAGQALVEDMTVVTNDPQIAAFGCKVLW